MAYVEAHAGLRDHLKTKKVARLLGIPKAQVIGHLLCLWWWCQEYAQDGDLSGYDSADISDAAEWDGDTETFVAALLNCGPKGSAGFLVHEDGCLLVNDWYQYGGKMFVQRQQAAARMRKMRNNTPGDDDVTRNTSVTDANVTPLLHDVTPIDKIREDKIIEEDKGQGATVVAQPTPPTPKRSKPAQSTEQQEMFGAVAAVCVLSPQLKAAEIGKAAASLVKAGFTVDQVLAFREWWEGDEWRASHTPTPTIRQLLEKIPQSTSTNGKPLAARPMTKLDRSLAAVDQVFAMIQAQQEVT